MTAAAIALLGAFGVARVQPRLANQLHAARFAEDVYVLPPPAELKAATLGHGSAAVDLLWAKLIVEFGIHLAERRPFPDVVRYLDAILELEPDYAPLFQYCATLILYRPDGGKEIDARVTRTYFERGIVSRPTDARVWLEYGQFMAWLSPSYLPPGPELDEWKKQGALAITRAVDMGSEASRSLSAVTLLQRYGESDAAKRALRRAYALTDDPAEREEIAAKLQRLESAGERERQLERVKLVEGRWREQAPFLARGTFLLLGPGNDANRCAGPGGASDAACASDWQEFLDARTSE